VLEALIVSRGESVQGVGTGLEWVGSPRDVSDARALELTKAGGIVRSQEGAHGGHEAAARLFDPNIFDGAIVNQVPVISLLWNGS
jgi:hypothetical protein